MRKVTFKGQPVRILGAIPPVGEDAPYFKLTDTDLKDRNLKEFEGQTLVLNVFPSLDTPVCAASVRRFNELAAGLDGVKVLAISRDLPFAHARFCSTEGIDRLINLSDYKTCDFGLVYGLEMTEGPLEKLLARAVIVIKPNGKIGYVQVVPEITDEPDYEDVMRYLKD